ncbi:hypothetical protein AVEN_130713-1 [Araneus ventricosus]|uniref:Uncharacterized protein n=1 Tax=Araneus ventricosus TaxID=182803 RepID=A0A4Y2FAC1_ARAVE|nr:hypothetical protein AVEN_130713-1 [Araneus ventricosus]
MTKTNVFFSPKQNPERSPHPPQWTDPPAMRMRHLPSKQVRTPENPVCIEEHHQFACDAPLGRTLASWALEFVDYPIRCRRFSSTQDRLCTDYPFLSYHR